MSAFETQSLRRQIPWLTRMATLLMVAPIIGLYIVRSPVKAWLLMGALVGVALLESSPIYWGISALLAAIFSRTVVALGAPGFLNFVHYPLTVCAFGIALIRGESSRPAKTIRTCLMVFLVINMLSWLVSDGEPLRPILNWVVFAEPFLLLYVFLVTPATSRTTSLLWKLLLAVCFVQVPLGLWQFKFVSNGNPDLIQGTFIGSGTGAHVAGGVAMLGVNALVCLGAASRSGRVKLLAFAAAVPLFGLAVLADAKQVVVAFVPGLIFSVIKITGIRPSTVLVPAGFLGLALFLAFNYSTLHKVGESGTTANGLRGKTAAFGKVLSKMGQAPLGWLLGVGPGNTVSRVALLTPGAQGVSSTSSVSALGLKTSPITVDLIAVSNQYYVSKHSSAWSPECSWFGLIGDLGLAGLVVYLWMLFRAWTTAGQGSWMAASAKGNLLALVLLGGVYSWLEEPAFTLLVVVSIGLAVLPRPATLAVQQPSPQSRRMNSFARSRPA